MKKILLFGLLVIGVATLTSCTKTETKPAVMSEPEPVIKPGTEVEKKMETEITNYSGYMGLEIKTTQEGIGERIVKKGDTISVQYTGKLTDGTKFDSSYDHGGTPFTFTVGAEQVIKGWDLGLIGTKVGEKRTLTIPPTLGYGSRGAGAAIPPNATLIFDVELVSIQ
jgi:FKBP-type peptidyl-prolyl cis-trans isomerase